MHINFGKRSIDITHKPLTLRNADTLQQWAERCRELATKHTKVAEVDVFVDLTTRYPELLTLINTDGKLNTDTIRKRVEGIRKGVEAFVPTDDADVPPVFDEAKATEQVIREMQVQLGSITKDYPLIAKVLQFNMPRYPVTMEALKLGVECIKATMDVTKMDAQDVEFVNNDDNWLDVSAREVADYVNDFCLNMS